MGVYVARVAGWLADSSLRTRETGLDQAPAAPRGVLTGAGVEKALVRRSG
jgi:hypothetical protein